MDNNKLFIGNIDYQAHDDDLKDHFAKAGNVVSATIISDRDSGRSKGFGFVEMSSAAEAQAAIDQLDGQDFNGRPLKVSIARPKQDRN